ncbi:MAG TPA: MauE/DoxX family redox-associated membrane protein, partial [Acidimicrobiia bacterium]|nr:MauE/DoxX family redox-associated membrane protein [Acidimicrobiia bacterium]
KLRARAATRRQMSALLGDRVGSVVAIVLPWLELLIALLLLVWWSAVPGVLAAVLLLLFTGVIVRANTRHLPCACFGGNAGNAPPGAGAIVRNALLVALAVLATASPR